MHFVRQLALLGAFDVALDALRGKVRHGEEAGGLCVRQVTHVDGHCRVHDVRAVERVEEEEVSVLENVLAVADHVHLEKDLVSLARLLVAARPQGTGATKVMIVLGARRPETRATPLAVLADGVQSFGPFLALGDGAHVRRRVDKVERHLIAGLDKGREGRAAVRLQELLGRGLGVNVRRVSVVQRELGVLELHTDDLLKRLVENNANVARAVERERPGRLANGHAQSHATQLRVSVPEPVPGSFRRFCGDAVERVGKDIAQDLVWPRRPVRRDHGRPHQGGRAKLVGTGHVAVQPRRIERVQGAENGLLGPPAKMPRRRRRVLVLVLVLVLVGPTRARLQDHEQRARERDDPVARAELRRCVFHDDRVAVDAGNLVATNASPELGHVGRNGLGRLTYQSAARRFRHAAESRAHGGDNAVGASRQDAPASAK